VKSTQVTKSRGWLCAVAGAGALVLVLAGCGGSDIGAEGKTPGTQATMPTTPVSGGSGRARITTFEAPASVACGAAETSTSFSVKYATRDAARAEVRVDGRPLELDDPAKGSIDVQVHCDPLPHDVVLFAYDAANQKVFEQKLVETKQ